MISVQCPNTKCPANYQVPDKYLGKSVVCKKCRTRFKVANKMGNLPTKNPKPNAAPSSLEREEHLTESQPQDAESRIKRKYVFLSLGLGAVSAAACIALIGFAGIAIVWSKLGTRPPETYGGIEISSSTVKASVVRFFSDKEAGFDYEFLSEDEMQVKTDLGKFPKNGDFDPNSFEKTVAAISDFYTELMKKHGLPPDKIVIVFASGVFQRFENAKVAPNQEKLRARVLSTTNHSPAFVTLEQELERQIKSLIQETDMDGTLLVDLGNSLCRGGGYDTRLKKYITFNPEIGVEGFLEKAQKDAESRGHKESKRPEYRKVLGDSCTSLVDDCFRQPLVKEMKKTTEINGRKRIELVGGAAWVTTTYKNPSGRAKKHTPLSKEHIDAFYREVRQEWGYPRFTTPKGLDDALTKKLQADNVFMEKRINAESLIAGTEMLKVLSEELTFKQRDVYFNNNGQKALVLGFMTEMWEQGKK